MEVAGGSQYIITLDDRDEYAVSRGHDFRVP